MKPVRLFFDLAVDVNCKEDEDEDIFVDMKALSEHITNAINEYLSAHKEAVGKENKLISVHVAYSFDDLIEDEK